MRRVWDKYQVMIGTKAQSNKLFSWQAVGRTGDVSCVI